MALTPQHEQRWWTVEGYTLLPEDPKVIGRQQESETSLRVFARTAGEAERLFAGEFVKDVRVTSVRVNR